MNSKVSVIVPCFNAEEHLSTCLESIQAQSFGDFEVILIDDGSSDSSYSIAKQFADSDERIKIKQIQNSGACVARNLGIELATGRYIKLLDADDYLAKGCLERQVLFLGEQLKNSKASDICCFGFSKRVDINGEIKYDQIPPTDVAARASLSWIVSTGPHTSEPLYPKAIFEEHGSFDEKLPRGQEYDLNVRLAVKGVKYIYDGIFTYCQRDHDSPGRISNRLPDDAHVWIDPVLALVRFVESTGNANAIQEMKRRQATWGWQIGRKLLRAYRPEAATKFFEFAKTLSPEAYISGGRVYRTLTKLFGPRFSERISKLIR